MPALHADEFEPRNVLSPWWEWIPTAVLFSFLPLGALTHAIVLQWGARAYAPGAGIRILFIAFVHGFITCPVIGYPLATALGTDETPSAKKTLGAILLLAVPFLSLAYYLGDFRDAWQTVDAALAVVPAVAIAILQYRRMRSPTGFIFVLAVTSFVPLFLVSDVLGPWPTYFAYETQGAGIYTVRALAAAAGIWLAFDAVLRERGSALDAAIARAAFAVLAAAAGLLVLPKDPQSAALRMLPAALLVLFAIPRQARFRNALLVVAAAALIVFGARGDSWAAPLRWALLALGVGVGISVNRSPASRRV